MSTASHYHFVTDWILAAPIDAVWDVLNTPEEWPTWWKGVVDVELVEPGYRDGVGSLRRMTWKSRLPYRLVFTMRTTVVVRPSTIAGRADGELQGTGVWSLTPADAGTAVRYDWRVEATTRWMRVLAPIARPIFAWNHDVIMQWGYEGLQRRLKIRP